MSVTKQFPQIIAPYCIALEKSVGAIVFRVDAKGAVQYLVMQYPHGHWEFPRGHIERGETEKQTMYREIEEETGIGQHVLEIDERFKESFSFTYKARGDEREDRKKRKRCLLIRKKVVFYLAQAKKSDVALSHEHNAFKWLEYAEAMERLTFGNAKKVITKAHKRLQKR